MENDDSDSYLRKRKPINYDEHDPQINMSEFSSDSDAALYLNDDDDSDTKKRRSKRKDEDDEQWRPTSSPPDIGDDFPLHLYEYNDIEKKHSKKKYGPKIFSEQIDMKNFKYALAYKDRRKLDSPSIYLDPLGKPCPFIPYDEVLEKLFNPQLLFERCQGVNTLMPEFEPLAFDKLQFFNLETSVFPFDYDYIRSMKNEQIVQIFEENDKELNKLGLVKLNRGAIVIPFDNNSYNSISIKANILYFDWKKLGEAIQFDVVLMDPPWPVTNAKMTRGVEINYEMMPEEDIASIPLNLIQTDGYLLMWVIAKEFAKGLQMMSAWGYEVINHINWIKVSKKGKYHPSNGYYIMHAKETLLIGIKGKGVPLLNADKFDDLIIQPRNLRQSHKPNRLYRLIEESIPGGKFLEIFARPHNLRSNWISLGNELPG